MKKIENHPHRQSLQRDLQPNNAYNPFSEKCKKMIEDMGIVELFALFETEPEHAMQRVFVILEIRHYSIAHAGIS